MTSLKQIEANRRDAASSTGPVTPEGKRRSRCNAVRHGLTAETVIGTLENADDYQPFELAVTSDYDAQTAVERELVLRLASVLWRLRRATAIETRLFELAAVRDSEIGQACDAPALVPTIRLVDRTQPSQDLGHRFLRALELPREALPLLNRYEYTLWRQARQLIVTLARPRRQPQSQRRHSPSLAGVADWTEAEG